MLTAVSKDILDKDTLTVLGLHDLSGKVTFDETGAKGIGGNSEVFKGVFEGDGNGQVDVAVKRLRFHLQKDDSEKVKVTARLHILLDRSIYSDGRSCLNGRSMPGRSFATKTFYSYWVSLSAQIPDFPCSSLNGCTRGRLGRMPIRVETR